MRVLATIYVLVCAPAFAFAETGGAPDDQVEQNPDEPSDVEQNDEAPSAPRGVVEAEVAFYRGRANLSAGGFVVGQVEAFSVSSLLGLRYRALDAFELDASWGFTVTRSQLETAFGDDDDGAFRSGNPWIGASWFGVTDGFPVVLRIGGGIALPAAALPGDPFAQHGDTAALVLAPASRGLWDAWLWAPDTLSVAVRAFAATRLHQYIAARLSGALAFLVPVRKDAGDDRGTEVAAQLGLDLALLPTSALTVGARIQAVLLTEGRDRFQGSIEPFIGVEASPVLLRLGLVINLDDPFGPGFGDGNVWGLRLGASLRY